MLHILLLILKIAGVILAVILGIVVLLVCMVLFVPVRYEASGKCDGTLLSVKGRIRVTWFLRAIRLDVYYKEKRLKWRIRILWIRKIGGHIKEENNHEKSGTVEMDEKETKDAEAAEISKGKEEIPEARQEVEKKPENSEEESEKSMEKIPETESGNKEAFEDMEKTQEYPEERERFSGKISEFLRRICEKIKERFQRILSFFQNMNDRIRRWKEKKDHILEFVKDEAHVGAFRKGKRELFKLLRRLRPRKLLLEARFGFSDPCTTGRILAGLSMLYPFMGESVRLMPDFENRVLKGHAEIKGRIYACYFLFLCWNLIWSRNIRKTYRDIKNFE